MLAVVPAAVCLIAALALRETLKSDSTNSVEEQKQESRFFNAFNVIAVAVACYLLAFDITGCRRHDRLLSLIFAAGLVVLLAMPLLVPVYSFFFKSSLDRDVERQIREPLVAEEDSAAEKEEEMQDGSVKRHPEIGEEHTIVEMVKTTDFWILFVSFLCGVGTGLCVMNNMGQIGLAVGYTDVTIFISFISIWGFFGRIVSGSLSEYFIRKSAMARPLWNAASQVLMAVGYIAMALALPGSLYIGSMLVGICYGVRLTITVAAASELFGLKYYGLLYNILILNLPLGSFLFSGLIAGYLYDLKPLAKLEGETPALGHIVTCLCL